MYVSIRAPDRRTQKLILKSLERGLTNTLSPKELRAGASERRSAAYLWYVCIRAQKRSVLMVRKRSSTEATNSQTFCDRVLEVF
jgi:hypothetical protein